MLAEGINSTTGNGYSIRPGEVKEITNEIAADWLRAGHIRPAAHRETTQTMQLNQPAPGARMTRRQRMEIKQ